MEIFGKMKINKKYNSRCKLEFKTFYPNRIGIFVYFTGVTWNPGLCRGCNCVSSKAFQSLG